MTEFTTPSTPIERDRWGRPLIPPPNGGKAKAYTRASKIAGALDNGFGLAYWQRCMVAKGMAMRADLQTAAIGLEYYEPKGEDKRELANIADEAMETAGSTVARNKGSGLHRLTEFVDRGEELPEGTSEQDRADIEAYLRATEGFKVLAIEEFVVNDALEAAGTPDRIYEAIDDRFAPVFAPGDRFIGDTKGLALDTPLPTPDGWTTIGEVGVGDRVFGDDGQPCTVTRKSDIKHLGTYVVTFDDGTKVVCDNEHIWWTQAQGEEGPTAKGIGEVIDTMKAYGQNQHRVPVAGPLDLPHADLPIDPYLLGCWLGDGHARGGVITKSDDLFEVLADDGHALGVRQAQPDGREHIATRTVLGLHGLLYEHGLAHNKHVPRAYQRASTPQRLALLRGLMDTDGCWNTARNTACFDSTDERLARDVHELVVGLGHRASFHEHEAEEFGLVVTAYRVEFTPTQSNPFRLPRKAAKAAASTKPLTRARWRVIVDVSPGPDVPTACIAVDSPNRTYLCGEAMVPTHNTGNVNYPLKFCMQLAVYANGQSLDLDTGERTALLDGLRTDVGVIVHLPPGEGKASLLVINLDAGLEALELAVPVERMRKREKRKGVLSQPLAVASAD